MNKGSIINTLIMKRIVFLGALMLVFIQANAQVLTGKRTSVDFYSHTSVEDIRAKTKSVTAVLDLGTNDFAFRIQMKTFDFPNDLMEEHYNENYLETAKYPTASYTGKIISPAKIDLAKDGTYNVTTKGTLEVHGVKQERTIPATIVISGGKATIKASFNIKLADHKIDVPTIVTAKIAESIAVNITSMMEK